MRSVFKGFLHLFWVEVGGCIRTLSSSFEELPRLYLLEFLVELARFSGSFEVVLLVKFLGAIVKI